MQIDSWGKMAKEINFNLEIDLSIFTKLVSKDAYVLDYGCGYGRISEVLYLRGYKNIIGVDTSEEMIGRGRLEYPHLSLEKINGSNLHFSRSLFDAIVVCAVLTCLPELKNKRDVLIEIERLLKPGGILHVVEFCDESNRIFESKNGILMHHQNPKEIKNLLSKFVELSSSEIKAKTIGGNSARAISYFGRKNT